MVFNSVSVSSILLRDPNTHNPGVTAKLCILQRDSTVPRKHGHTVVSWILKCTKNALKFGSVDVCILELRLTSTKTAANDCCYFHEYKDLRRFSHVVLT